MKHLALASILALTAGLATPALAQVPTATNSLTIPVSGAGEGATFEGTLEIKRFVEKDGGLVAQGTLTGVVTTAEGVVGSVVKNVAVPAVVDPAQATCDILHLDLGPLALDLLGLKINLSQVVLDITAEAGPGNLLGNLLCAVVNLLNDPSGLARLLNNILAILG
jgi:hypothetical protein